MLMCPPSIASVEARETYVSAAGPVTVTRHLYRPAGRSTKSICPLELRASIVGGLWTPRAVRQGTFVMAHLTPREGATLFSDLDGMQPSASPLDRLPKTLSARSERAEQSRVRALADATHRRRQWGGQGDHPLAVSGQWHTRATA